MGYFYSSKLNVFFISSLIETYQQNGTLPDELVHLPDTEYLEFFVNTPPAGKQRIAGNDGNPAWGDIPPLTDDELKENAEAKKMELKQQADNEISWRQDAVDAGIATEEETAALVEWKKYRVLLMRVDTAKPEWPPLPGEQAI